MVPFFKKGDNKASPLASDVFLCILQVLQNAQLSMLNYAVERILIHNLLKVLLLTINHYKLMIVNSHNRLFLILRFSINRLIG